LHGIPLAGPPSVAARPSLAAARILGASQDPRRSESGCPQDPCPSARLTGKAPSDRRPPTERPLPPVPCPTGTPPPVSIRATPSDWRPVRAPSERIPPTGAPRYPSACSPFERRWRRRIGGRASSAHGGRPPWHGGPAPPERHRPPGARLLLHVGGVHAGLGRQATAAERRLGEQRRNRGWGSSGGEDGCIWPHQIQPNDWKNIFNLTLTLVSKHHFS